ncbi:MAG: energy transducer TonB [Bacteroidaceae bacterium]|nr:energy transducer TonB [Bacteroidaceae bacterium]
MEVKKSKKADLESTKGTGLLIGYIAALATMFACFEYTTREYEETDVVYATTSFVSEEEVIPITQPIFTAAPPPPAETPAVAEILDIVDNNTDIEEEKIETSEDTHEATSGPSVQHTSGPVMVAPGPVQEESDEGEIFEIVEHNPEFPGGEKALMAYLQKNLKYPAAAQENGIQGRVFVQFVVNKDGSIVDPKILRGADPSLDKEAMRVVQGMPKWIPGKQRGKTVRVRFTLPVMFRLQ